MENQTPIGTPNSLQTDQSSSVNQQPAFIQQKTIFLPIAITAVICAILFGIGGYYLGKQSFAPREENTQSEVSPQPTQSKQVTLPSSTPDITSSTTSKPVNKITYKLPSGWQTIKDTTGILEVGYDSARYGATAKEKQVDLSGKWVGTQGSDLRRLGWNKNFYVTSYDGGPRHTELYKILGVTANSSDWKAPNYYSEREYSYNGWSCLIINGVNISQFPVAWGYCPISSNEALVLTFDGYEWSEIEQQLTAVRLLR